MRNAHTSSLIVSYDPLTENGCALTGGSANVGSDRRLQFEISFSVEICLLWFPNNFFQMFGAGFGSGLASVQRVFLIDRISKNHFTTLLIYESDSGLFIRMDLAEKHGLGPTCLHVVGNRPMLDTDYFGNLHLHFQGAGRESK
jgi:hypothetical protein